MLLPGPEAQQLAIYIGWLLHRTAGGLVAGILFVLPGAAALMALSVIYATFGQTPLIAALFFGLKAAVLAIVLLAVARIGRRALRKATLRAISVAAFVGIFFLHVPFPLIVLGAGLIGFAGARAGLAAFTGDFGHAAGAGSDAASALGTEIPAHARPTWHWSPRVAAICLLLWLTPVAALLVWLGPDDVFTRIGVFFSEMAVVSFGGAYAVLAYVAQAAVQSFGWLRPGEMLDGLGMAETTPGPLIMVVQFVGFMAAFRNAHGLPPLVAGALGGLLTTWVTFVPCFLWIFLGAPFIEGLRANRALAGALAAITAAVVGVILNLAIWFGLHVLFADHVLVAVGPLRFDLPVPPSIDWSAAVLTLLAVLLVFRLRVGMLATLAACAGAGIAWRMLPIWLG